MRRLARGRLASRMWPTYTVSAVEQFLHLLRSQAAQPKKEANERRGKPGRNNQSFLQTACGEETAASTACA